MLKLGPLFTRLELEHPAQWRAKRVRHNLAEGVDDVMQGTGRTTVILVEAVATALHEGPVTVVMADAMERARAVDLLAVWMDLLVDDHSMQVPDVMVLDRVSFTEKVREDSAAMLARRTVYDHRQPWGQ